MILVRLASGEDVTFSDAIAWSEEPDGSLNVLRSEWQRLQGAPDELVWSAVGRFSPNAWVFIRKAEQ